MTTERGLDRLTYFTDAIAAIAITLLVLPLVERVGESADGNPTDFLRDNGPTIGAFVLSFFVIARLWAVHHAVFEHVVAYTPTLRWLSLAWAFTIVLLPLPTAMVAQWKTEPLTVAFYIGTMALSSVLSTAMVLYIRRHSTIESTENPVTRKNVTNSIVTTIEFVVALLLGSFVPGVTYFALLILFASVPIGLVTAARERRANA